MLNVRKNLLTRLKIDITVQNYVFCPPYSPGVTPSDTIPGSPAFWFYEEVNNWINSLISSDHWSFLSMVLKVWEKILASDEHTFSHKSITNISEKWRWHLLILFRNRCKHFEAPSILGFCSNQNVFLSLDA